MQGVVNRSQKKTELLKGYNDTILRGEELEKELDKSRKYSALLQSKLDIAFAQYHNEIQDMVVKKDEVVKKNKSLQQKNNSIILVTPTMY